MLIKEYPKCIQKQYNCFAFQNGRCLCLTNTKFKKKCSFYKTTQECEKGQKNNYSEQHSE